MEVEMSVKRALIGTAALLGAAIPTMASAQYYDRGYYAPYTYSGYAPGYGHDRHEWREHERWERQRERDAWRHRRWEQRHGYYNRWDDRRW